MSARRVFASTALLLVYLLLSPLLFISSAALAEGVLSFPATGPFNGFLNHLNVVECTNTAASAVSFRLSLIRNDGREIGSVVQTAASGGAAVHTILNDIRDGSGQGIENSYGVYVVSVLSGDSSGLRCLSVVYRLSAGGEVEYAFSIPLENPQSGESFGLYNSFDPSGYSFRPTQNWLTIYNSDSRQTFQSTVRVRNETGIEQKSIRVVLQPYQRLDIALGHDQGKETTGLYDIQPDSASAVYSSFLTRYSTYDDSVFNFAFYLPSGKGGCGESVLASTTANAANWLVIGNPNASAKNYSIILRDRFGAEIASAPQTVRAFSQQHLYLNPFIDPAGQGRTGSVTINCGNTSDRLLTQAAFYGHDVSNPASISWAYSVTPNHQVSGSTGLSASVNTYLGAANWFEVANEFSAAQSFALKVNGASPSQLSVNALSAVSLRGFGTSDVPIHEIVGKDFVGTAAAVSEIGKQPTGQLLRVYPDKFGGIAYIMPTAAAPIVGQSGGGGSSSSSSSASSSSSSSSSSSTSSSSTSSSSSSSSSSSTSSSTSSTSSSSTSSSSSSSTTSSSSSSTSSGSPNGNVNVPSGYYLLRPTTGTISLPDSVLTNPKLQGIVIRARWSDVNPSKGHYDWSRIKDAVSKITNAKKHWKLKIFTGISDPVWLQQEGVQYFTFNNPNPQPFHPDPTYSMPVPWDTKMLGFYDTMLAAAAAEFDGNPYLDLVAIGGPTQFSLEMHLPDEVSSLPGYSPQKLINAWKTSINSYANHFKKTMGNVDIASSAGTASEGTTIAQSVADYVFTVLGARGAVQHDAYNAKASLDSYYVNQIVVGEGALGHTFGFEQVTASTDSRYGGSFASSVSRACGYGAAYMDIYTPDDSNANGTFCGR